MKYIIPLATRKRMESDPFYETCIHWRYRKEMGKGRVTWEHAWIYAGKRIQEEWAIVPCLASFNIGVSPENKRFNQYVSLKRTKFMGLWTYIKSCYPLVDWKKKFELLDEEFGHIKITF